jgi:hypothetical protein
MGEQIHVEAKMVAWCSQVNQTLSPGAPSLQSRVGGKGATQGGHYNQGRKKVARGTLSVLQAARIKLRKLNLIHLRPHEDN